MKHTQPNNKKLSIYSYDFDRLSFSLYFPKSKENIESYRQILSCIPAYSENPYNKHFTIDALNSEFLLGSPIQKKQSKYYQYRLISHEYTLELMATNCVETIQENNPPIRLNFYSDFLSQDGNLKKVSKIIDIICSAFKVNKSFVSYIELYADYSGWFLTLNDIHRFKTRTREHEPFGVDRAKCNRDKISGLRFGHGRSDCHAVIYNKSLEASIHNKHWYYERIGISPDIEIWRTEIRMRRPYLKHLGIETLQSLIEKKDGIWEHFTKKCLIHVINGQPSAEWQELQSIPNHNVEPLTLIRPSTKRLEDCIITRTEKNLTDWAALYLASFDEQEAKQLITNHLELLLSSEEFWNGVHKQKIKQLGKPVKKLL